MKRIFFVIATVVTLSFAFSSEGFSVMPDGPGSFQVPQFEQREKLRQRIESIRMWKLTKALDLDEKTAAAVFPIMNRYDRKRTELQQDLMEGIRELRNDLDRSDKNRLSASIAMLGKKQRELQNIREQEWADLRRVLTVEQQARLLVFLDDFRHEMRGMISKAAKRGKRQ